MGYTFGNVWLKNVHFRELVKINSATLDKWVLLHYPAQSLPMNTSWEKIT